MPRRAILAALVAVPVLAQTTGDVTALRTDLLGSDKDRAVSAASNLGALAPRPEALQALLYALELGLPPRQALAAIEAVGPFKGPQAFDLLRLYATHRRADLRRAALDALAAIPDARVAAVLVGSLGDTDPTVRAKAARLCGERKEKTAEAGLLKLLVAGDAAAAEPLGIVAGIDTAKKAIDLIGQADDRSLAIALGTMLLRPDLGPDPLRVDLVKTLGKIPGDTPLPYLEDYDRSVPEQEPRPSRLEARRIIEGRKNK